MCLLIFNAIFWRGSRGPWKSIKLQGFFNSQTPVPHSGSAHVKALFIIFEKKKKKTDTRLMQFYISKSKKEGLDRESIQSSTTPDPGYQWENDNVTIRQHKRELRGQPFPSRWPPHGINKQKAFMPPGVLGIWGEWLFIFMDLGCTGNYFRGSWGASS